MYNERGEMVVLLGQIFVSLLIISACVAIVTGMIYFLLRIYLAAVEAMYIMERERKRMEK